VDDPTEPQDEFEPEVSDETLGSFDEDPAFWIFDTTVLHHVEITLHPGAAEALTAEPYEYSSGDVVIDGVAIPDVALRLRGKLGSFRDLDGKPKWKMDFNDLVPGRRVSELEGLSLNNSVVDCSYLKESIGYKVFDLAGVPTPRVAMTQVTVDGTYYGLYVMVENEDDAWLRRTQEFSDGNLYDGKYFYDPDDWWGFAFNEFTYSAYQGFQLEEGTDVGHADVLPIVEANEQYGGTNQFYAATAPYVNWQNVHAFLFAEQWTGQVDGYAMNTNNYRFYINPETTKMDMLVWDLDYSFIYAWEWGSSWDNPSGELASACFDDDTCRNTHKLAVQNLSALVDPAQLIDYLDALDDLTLDVATTDPKRECRAEDVASARADLASWIQNRNGELADYWGL
jgi:spore coat protein CotH